MWISNDCGRCDRAKTSRGLFFVVRMRALSVLSSFAIRRTVSVVGDAPARACVPFTNAR
jgi:hypothetical protein